MTVRHVCILYRNGYTYPHIFFFKISGSPCTIRPFFETQCICVLVMGGVYLSAHIKYFVRLSQIRTMSKHMNSGRCGAVIACSLLSVER